MKKILILMGRYLPGYKDGGPVRTIVNLVNNLGSEYDFYIMTSDRDHGDENPYPEIKANEWNQVGAASVYYVPPKGFHFGLIKKLAQDMDVIYCCGPYDQYAIKSMILKKIGSVKCPFVIASMGSFSTGAYAIHSNKKRVFVNLFQKIGLFKNIIWSVTSTVEEQELKNVLGLSAQAMIAEDLPRPISMDKIWKKRDHELKIIFISRICEMKNLIYAIELLKQVTGKVIFDIYGTIEDADYWKKCQLKLSKLPSNIVWHYCGICDSNQVPDTFSNYDVFLFPTLGENFGHVINEAMVAGCYPIISNTTPWLDLNEHECGTVLPLENSQAFVWELERLIETDSVEFEILIENIQKYISVKNINSIKNTGYKQIFNL